MNRLSINSNKKLFNTIYVEEEAYKYPLTKQILNKYKDSFVITIKHYKDVFNRTNQNFNIQKQNQSLILAVKNVPFLYNGPNICQNFGYSKFYYTSFLLNCIFDCKYCYLQGMYPSANIVAFVNIEDFKNAILNISKDDSIYLAASYDTDLIAFHNIIPYLDYFYDFLKTQGNIFTEVRTKSANTTFYKNHKPFNNLIIAFTLAPEEIIKKYENYTPSLKSRIEAIKTAISQGFNIRICFDPIFINTETDSCYEAFYDEVFSEINPDKIIDIGYGFFRMSKEFFKRIEKHRNDCSLFLEDYSVSNNVVSYDEKLQKNIKEKHFKILTKYIEKEKIFTL